MNATHKPHHAIVACCCGTLIKRRAPTRRQRIKTARITVLRRAKISARHHGERTPLRRHVKRALQHRRASLRGAITKACALRSHQRRQCKYRIAAKAPRSKRSARHAAYHWRIARQAT